MKALEEAAFDRGVSAESLMDEAGARMGRFLVEFYPEPGTAVACLGKGNNGGDALVALRVLRDAGWRIAIRSAGEVSALGELPARKLQELGEVAWLEGPGELAGAPRPLLLLDGLLGIGASGPVREPLRGLAREMNHLRATAGARVAAVDIPTGVNADTGEVGEDAVVADVTCVIAAGKPGLVRTSCLNHVGRIELIPLAELMPPEAGASLITRDCVQKFVRRRSFDTHKGQAGRVGIVAGSPGYLGAAVLCCLGALRGGAGLVTLYVREDHYPLMVSAGVPPEVMVKPVPHARAAVEDQADDALAIGPGLTGMDRGFLSDLLYCFGRTKCPVVLDAEGLNVAAEVLGSDPGESLGDNFLLTPHPGEMARLLPGVDGGRAELARAAVDRWGAHVLFKGARTVVTGPAGGLFYNTTGTPGMATGGQGDLLTGLLAALAARGLDLTEAACAGAWLAGRAAELALAEGGQSEESLLPTDGADFLGAAFRDARGEG